MIGAVLFNAQGSARQAAYIAKRPIKEMLNGELAHYMKEVEVPWATRRSHQAALIGFGAELRLRLSRVTSTRR